jgi:Four helix bundle sensory module for signal transduction
MNAFNLSVRAKLYATLALTTIVMIAVGVVGLTGSKSSNTDLDAIFSNRFMPTGWVGTIETHERELLSRAEDVVIRQDAGAVKAALDLLKERETEINDLAAKLKATDLTAEERKIVDEFSRHEADVL